MSTEAGHGVMSFEKRLTIAVRNRDMPIMRRPRVDKRARKFWACYESVVRRAAAIDREVEERFALLAAMLERWPSILT